VKPPAYSSDAVITNAIDLSGSAAYCADWQGLPGLHLGSGVPPSAIIGVEAQADRRTRASKRRYNVFIKVLAPGSPFK